MPKEMLIAIGAGLFSAIGATSFLMHVPGAMIFVYLATLPLFASGFALGPRAVGISAATGFMATGLLGGNMAAGFFGITLALPAWLMVRQLLLRQPLADDANEDKVQWFPPGEVLCWLTLLAAAVFTMVAAYGFGGDQTLSASVSSSLQAVLKEFAPTMTPQQHEMATEIMAPLFPGFVGVSWLMMIIVNATLGQNLLVKMQKNIRPTPAYIDLQLPNWISLPLIASALLALIGSGEIEYTGRNLVIILAVPFFFLGLSVVHTFARKWGYPQVMLVVFYVILVLSAWVVLAVAALGAIEQWSGLKTKGPMETNH
ncbi:MAG: DUF2232 domain-containing protein [Proteobacteria bacterium]|nr:DUF2232 domain-containing protein [Pseudomonadota bacterium]MDA1023117.1 DUF2232 domain-containing protein [Pseudomonadota bacterium]